jgi:anti-anti-sigma factor
MMLEFPTSVATPRFPGFHCEVQPERDAVRVVALGELDAATVPLLDAQIGELREAGFPRLRLDLSQLGFIDSTGVHLLLRWDAEARRDGFAIELVQGAPAVQRVFELTGTANTLPFIRA